MKVSHLFLNAMKMEFTFFSQEVRWPHSYINLKQKINIVSSFKFIKLLLKFRRSDSKTLDLLLLNS